MKHDGCRTLQIAAFYTSFTVKASGSTAREGNDCRILGKIAMYIAHIAYSTRTRWLQDIRNVFAQRQSPNSLCLLWQMMTARRARELWLFFFVSYSIQCGLAERKYSNTCRSVSSARTCPITCRLLTQNTGICKRIIMIVLLLFVCSMSEVWE